MDRNDATRKKSHPSSQGLLPTPPKEASRSIDVGSRKCRAFGLAVLAVSIYVSGILMAPLYNLPFQQCHSDVVGIAATTHDPSYLTTPTTWAHQASTSTLHQQMDAGGGENDTNCFATITGNAAADCALERRAVPICFNSKNDDVVDYFPLGVRVNRCGGFCSVVGSTNKECVPVRMTVRTVQVSVLKADETNENRCVDVEEHLECGCRCKVKPQDCTPKQRHNSRTCRCECEDEEAARRCHASVDHLWDEKECRCNCLQVTDCSTGYHFQHDTCTCVQDEF